MLPGGSGRPADWVLIAGWMADSPHMGGRMATEPPKVDRMPPTALDPSDAHDARQRTQQLKPSTKVTDSQPGRPAARQQGRKAQLVQAAQACCLTCRRLPRGPPTVARPSGESPPPRRGRRGDPAPTSHPLCACAPRTGRRPSIGRHNLRAARTAQLSRSVALPSHSAARCEPTLALARTDLMRWPKTTGHPD